MKKFRDEYLQSHTCEKEMTKVNIFKLILNICFLIALDFVKVLLFKKKVVNPYYHSKQNNCFYNLFLQKNSEKSPLELLVQICSSIEGSFGSKIESEGKLKKQVNTKTSSETSLKFKESLPVNFSDKTEKIENKIMLSEKIPDINKNQHKRTSSQLKTCSPKKQKLNNYRNLVSKTATQSSFNKNNYKTLQNCKISEQLNQCYRSLQGQNKFIKANSQLSPKTDNSKTIGDQFFDNRQVSNVMKGNQLAFYLQNNIVASQLVNQQLQNFYASRLRELHLLYGLQQKQQYATSYFTSPKSIRRLTLYEQPNAIFREKSSTLPSDVSAFNSFFSLYGNNLQNTL